LDTDRERAWRLATPHLLYQQNLYQRWYTEASDRPTDHFEPVSEPSGLEPGAYLIGEPAEVAEQVLEYHRAVPFTHLSFWTLLPGMPLKPALRSLELFAQDVLPQLHQLVI
jgi:alkanesulfonate monooxygenase SsuD/methylene tetrahydromethanopterin reductase-like flavin-dependent oxidoreductase (luciferase family)